MEHDLIIQSPSDWEKFVNFTPAGGMDVVVGPMVYRVAEVFLRGRPGVSDTLQNTEEVWKCIKRNLDCLRSCSTSLLSQRIFRSSIMGSLSIQVSG